MASVTIPFISRALRAVCPACGHEALARSRRRTLADWALSLLSIRPYRCPACNRRVHAVPGLMPLPLNSKERTWLRRRAKLTDTSSPRSGNQPPAQAFRASA